ncbi:uncharacterized protein K444DRAFT_360730 [Hyaloscypha bicolor E]|uniref:Uncharacterized protein n=1 Tax=Hyaloscypha bicolor E TaxID=1095630 RepID=A0A2J6TG71_9HELO|nr:uncharacterized protein K444DRAFT_360730 [Hyaloscypha bicolor E]PMD62013.1 hypothetical protein K444DRAFT_360730 [Hyaloscypha bicolor E]
MSFHSVVLGAYIEPKLFSNFNTPNPYSGGLSLRCGLNGCPMDLPHIPSGELYPMTFRGLSTKAETSQALTETPALPPQPPKILCWIFPPTSGHSRSRPCMNLTWIYVTRPLKRPLPQDLFCLS